MRFFLLVPILLCSLLLNSSPAQVTWENQVWTSVQGEKKLFKKTELELTLEARWNLDPLMARTWFPNIAISHEWAKWLNTVIHYRYITDNRGMGYTQSANRLMFDAIFSHKPAKTEYILRLRVGNEDEISDPEGLLDLQEFIFRQKLSVKRKIRKQEFTLSFEQFERINGDNVDFYQRRYVLASPIKFDKHNQLNLFVMYQDLISTRRINFGIGYAHKF